MHRTITLLVAGAIAGPALAQEPVGCDKFKWPLDRERAMLTGKDIAAVASGGRLASPPPVSAAVTLGPFAGAKLPLPPERAPRAAGSFAGFVEVAAPSRAGTYKISLSAGGWIDVVQAGRLVKSGPSSGVTDCEGIRKSVKFDLAAEPFAVQLTDVRADTVGIAITGD